MVIREQNEELGRMKRTSSGYTFLAIHHQQFQHWSSVRSRLSGASSSSVPSDVAHGRQLPCAKSNLNEPVLVEESQVPSPPPPPPSPVVTDPTRSRGLNHYELNAVNDDLCAVASRGLEEETDLKDMKEKAEEDSMKEVEEVEMKEEEEKTEETTNDQDEDEKKNEDIETKGGDVVDTGREEQPEGPPHHILDPLAERILKRQDQDKLYVEKRGKQRGRGKGKGRGRGKQVKDPVCRNLFPSDEEGSDKEVPPPDVESEPAKPKRKAKPAFKRPAASASASRGRKPKAETVEEPVPPVEPAPKKRARKPKQEEKAEENKKDKANKEKENKPGKRIRKDEDTTQQPKPKVEKIPIPVFHSCTVVPYWSRLACGLKVPCNLGKEDGESTTKNGLQQVFYVAVKGATMKEHVDLIVEMAPGFSMFIKVKC